ncbi:MAG: serine/threonine-protein kinase [Chitinophagales bacterium]
MNDIVLTGNQANYIFNPYDRANFLGSGGMGKVFVGHVIHIHNKDLTNDELSVGDKVAIKVIHKELTRNKSVIKRAYKESLVSVRHNNLILMLDFVIENKIVHIISKFIEGETLSKVLNDRDRQPIPKNDALNITLQILNGLKALHHNNIIHRDIKPSNINISKYGKAVIMDFGVAKISEGERLSVTGVGSILGTPHYSSPEQVRGETDKINGASDIYSAGITLYEMLTGHSPFQADSEFEVIKMQVNEPLPETPLIDKKLFKIIRKLTEKDVKRRYKIADHAIEDIQYYMDPPVGIRKRLKYFLNRLKR